jgi:hypothetical protein
VEFSSSLFDLHVSFCSHLSAHARKSERRSLDLIGQLRIELLPRDNVFCSRWTRISSSSSSHEWLWSNAANHVVMSLFGQVLPPSNAEQRSTTIEFFTMHVRKSVRYTFCFVG